MAQTHLYINKEWIVSLAARRVYRVASIFSVSLVAVILTFIFAEDVLRQLPLMTLLFRPALFLCLTGAVLTSAAMEYYYFGFDDLSRWSKIIWFFILCVFPLGAPLYCYTVYSHSKYFQPADEPTTGASQSQWRIDAHEHVVTGMEQDRTR